MSTEQKTADKAPRKKVAVPDFDTKKDQIVIGTGENRHLQNGVEYTVSGADAGALIESGYATLKSK